MGSQTLTVGTCPVCQARHGNTALCDGCALKCARAIDECPAHFDGCENCVAHRAAVRALSVTDLSVYALREVREAREPVLPGLGALDIAPWMERPFGASGVIVPLPVETAHATEPPAAWNPIERRFEPASIVLPPSSRQSLREARERADAALGDPRGRVAVLELVIAPDHLCDLETL